MNQPPAGLKLLLRGSLAPLLAFMELKSIGALAWMRLWVNGTPWPVWSLIQATSAFSTSAIGLFCFLVTRALVGVAPCASFRNFSFAFTAWLTVCRKRPSFRPISALDMPSSLSVIISSFWFKVRGVRLFLPLAHDKAIVGRYASAQSHCWLCLGRGRLLFFFNLLFQFLQDLFWSCGGQKLYHFLAGFPALL